MIVAIDEAEVLSRVVRWARADERERAAVLTSSRANVGASRDLLTDFDVALVATRPASFEGDDWLGLIGRPLLRVRDVESADGTAVHHCMALFDDWVNIDFSFWPTAV